MVRDKLFCVRVEAWCEPFGIWIEVAVSQGLGPQLLGTEGWGRHLVLECWSGDIWCEHLSVRVEVAHFCFFFLRKLIAGCRIM